MNRSSVKEAFRRFAKLTSDVLGTPWAFAAAILVVVVWFLTGPYFKFSDPWQLVINTGTTIITFLMVFLIQNTQNRDMLAIQLKLDELIRTRKQARNSMIDLDALTDEELQHLQKEFQEICQRRTSSTECIPSTAKHRDSDQSAGRHSATRRPTERE